MLSNNGVQVIDPHVKREIEFLSSCLMIEITKGDFNEVEIWGIVEKMRIIKDARIATVLDAA